MKRMPFLAIILLACAFPAYAQDAMKKDAANKPAEPEVKVVLDSTGERFAAEFRARPADRGSCEQSTIGPSVVKQPYIRREN